MIIKEIHIDGFGIFNGFSLTGLEKGINVILGNNETGKSTLLKFLRYTLFGYPRFKDRRMPPLNGGNHGGRIKAVLSSGREVLFERLGDDHINLLFNDRETKNQSQWSQLLGNASAELYNNVYAFSLEELMGLDSLSQSGVEDKIFSVGLGLGKTSIGEVESRIQERIDKIYKLRGSVQLIPQILKELEKKKSRIAQIQENLPKYQLLTREIRRLKINVDELDDGTEKLRTEKNKLDNYIKCYDSFITIIKANEALEELPAFQDFPVNGVEQLEKLEEKEAELYTRLEELGEGNKEEKGIREIEETIESISFNSKLLEEDDRIEYLRKNLEKYKQSVDEKNEEEQKIIDYSQFINQRIVNINKQWTEQDVTGFVNLTVHNNKIETYKHNLDSLVEDKRDMEAQLKVGLIQSKESALNINRFINLISIILIIGSIPVFYYNWYVPGGTLFLISLLLFLGKKYFVKRDSYGYLQNQIDSLKLEEEKIKYEYKDYLENQLNLEGSLSPDAVMDVFKGIKQLKNDIAERDKIEEKINKQRLPFIQKFEREVYFLRDILKGKEKLEDEVSFNIRNKVSDNVKGRQESENKKNVISNFNSDQGRNLQFGVTGNLKEKGKSANIDIIVNRIITDFDNSRVNYDNKEKLEAELNRKKKELKVSESKLKYVQRDIESLLVLVGAESRDDFRKKYEENDKVKFYIEGKESAIETMEKIVGRNKSEEVIAYLTANEKEIIEENINKLDRDIQSMTEESAKKRDELGRKSNEIESIEGESELAELLTEFETEKQKLQDAYKEWIKGKIALEVLTDVKVRYEKEKQPEVIKKSSSYFNLITGDRYKKIRASLNKKNVAVYDAQEASKTIEQLSRGTQEQLLISLRLGFIEEYERQSEPLPVIVDEVLVNFDPYRGKKTAEIFQKFAENRQILLFTCHPSTIDYFDRSDSHIININ